MKKIKNIFFDLLIPFENFIHWNISKLVIFIAGFLIWLISIIPFLIIVYVLETKNDIPWWTIKDIFSTRIVWFDNPALLQIYKSHEILFNFYVILWLLAIIIFVLFYNYSNVLLAKLHLWYLKKEDVSVSKNSYFDFWKIWKYFCITINFLLYLLFPIVIFLVWYFIIVLIFDIPENASNIFSNFTDFNYFSSFSFSLFALLTFCIFLFLYLIYRIIFAYIILIDEENYELDFSYRFYVKESFALTKSIKKFFFFLFYFFIFFLILLPFYKIGDYIKTNLISNLKTINYSTKQIPIIFPEEKIDTKKINLSKLNKNTQKYTIIYIIYFLLYFLVITWLINVLVVSFYRRFILIDRKTMKHEKWISWKWKYIIQEKIKIIKNNNINNSIKNKTSWIWWEK